MIGPAITWPVSPYSTRVIKGDGSYYVCISIVTYSNNSKTYRPGERIVTPTTEIGRQTLGVDHE